MEQQQPDGFPAHSRNQASLYRLFGHESHGPTSPARRRNTANHGDDAFSFRRLQQCCRAGALLVIKSLVQPRLFVTAANLAHGLGRQGNEGGNLCSRLALMELLQRQSAKYRAHRLHSAAEHALQLVTVRLLKAYLQPPISSHAPG